MTITTGMYYAFMVMLFLATNGHLRLLTIFFISCELIPFGTVTFSRSLRRQSYLCFGKALPWDSSLRFR